jgi:hypothetical protein
MRGSAKLAVVLLGVAPLLQACSMLGGGEPPRRTASQVNPDCARLKPLVVRQDGDLPRTDMEAQLQAAYKKADVDNSGDLSSSEASPVNESLRVLKLNAAPVMDINGDGRINFQEYASGWRTMFDYCGSGDVVSQSDMQKSPSTTTIRPERPPIAKPGTGGSTRRPGGWLVRRY